MRKSTWLRAATICALLCGSVWQMQAEKRCVYVYGMDWSVGAPITENQDKWDNYRIWETEEGSNVYEGILTQTNPSTYAYFRFYTELGEDNSSSWKENFIGPAYEKYNYTTIDVNPNNGIYCTSALNIKEYWAYEPGIWCLEVPESTNYFKFHLDLNKKELVVITDNAIVPVFNSDVEPTLQNADSYTAIMRSSNHKNVPTQFFVPAGECSFRLYSFFENSFIGPKSDTELLKRENRINKRTLTPGYNRWTVPNWGGGSLTFSGSSLITLNVSNVCQWKNDDNLAELWPENAYIVGEFNGWDCSNAPAMTRNGDEFRYELPAGSEGQFCISSMLDWMGQILKSGLSTRNGKTVYYGALLESAGGSDNFNIESDEATTVVFNPKERLVYTYPTAQGTPDAMTEDPRVGLGDTTLPSPDGMDYLLAVSSAENVKIDRDNFGYVVNNFTRIPQTSPGVYEGSIPNMSGVRFLKSVGATPDGNEYITPGESDKAATLYRGYGTSSFTVGGEDSGFWTGVDDVTYVKIDTNTRNYSSVEFGKKGTQDFIYVIGTPTKWTSPTAANYDYYQDFRLLGTTNGAYYGSVPAIPEIEGGPVSFRFMTDLKGWTTETSWGPDVPDFFEVSVECDNSRSYPLMKGLSNYCFENYTGERIYILADLDHNKVTFSPTPMDVEIGPATGRAEIFYIDEAYDERYHLYNEDSTYGMWHSSADDKVLIHSRKMEFGQEEAEWKGSYVLEPADPDADVVIDEFGVARVPLVERDGISTVPANTISLAKLPYGNYNFKLTGDRKTLIIYSVGSEFLIGAPTGDKPLTLDNYRDFAGYYNSNNYYGAIYHIPSGKFDFHFGKFATPEEGERTVDMEWKNGIVSATDLGLYGGIANGNTRFRDNDWKGGYIMVDRDNIIDLSKCDAVMARSYFSDEKVAGYGYAVMDKQNAEGTLFKARVNLKNDGVTTAHMIFTVLYGDACYILAGSPSYYYGKMHGTNTAYFDGNRLELPLACSSNAYEFPHVGEATVDVTLDLANMTATLDVVDMESLDTFNLYSDDDTLDGLEGVESGSEPDVVTACADVPEKEEDVEVNFVNTDNEVVMPESDVRVSFDEHGNYVSSYTTRPVGANSRCKAASAAHRWIIPAEYTGDEISFRIDKNTGKVHIAASKAVNSYYVIEREQSVYPNVSVFDLADHEDRMLRKTGEGVYEGEMKLPASKLMSIAGGATANARIWDAVCSRYSDTTIDMRSAEDAVVALMPRTGDWWIAPFTIDGNDNDGTHHLVLNLNNYTLTIKKDLTSVENVESEAGTQVEGLKGCIRIACGSDTVVDIFNIQGQLVKRARIDAGVTFIDIPAGLYIAAGKKVLVR